MSSMSKVVQVRNVPDEVHAALVTRAAAAGMSLSDYVLRQLELVTVRDANAALLLDLAQLPSSKISGAEAVREVRFERDEELTRRVAGS